MYNVIVILLKLKLYYVSDSNLSIVCGPSCIYLILPPSSAILVVIEVRVYSIGGPIAEAAAVATNLRLVPFIYT